MFPLASTTIPLNQVINKKNNLSVENACGFLGGGGGESTSPVLDPEEHL